MRNHLFALAGAVIGGAIGYFAFFWIARQGFYGIILPGGLLGLGAGIVKNHSRWVAVVCGALAAMLGLITEWQFRPFIKDETLTYFLAHLYELQPITLLLIALGGLIGFYVPFRRYAEST
jgi:hypothetical protein